MNRRQFVGFSGAMAFALAAGSPSSVVRAQIGYSSEDLGLPADFESVVPIALDANGVVAVMASVNDETAVFTVSGGTFTRLGSADVIPYATSIGANGNVGGWIEDDNPVRDVPIIFAPGSQAEMPGDRLVGRVYAVQEAGTAVGEAAIDPTKSTRKAVIWTDQDVRALEGLPADTASCARDINAMGEIVGWIERNVDDTSGRMAVILSRDEPPIELGTIGGNWSEAVAINEQGVVVGNSSTAEGQADVDADGIAAFSWSDDVLTPLPTLDGQRWSHAADVTSYSLVVGTIGLKESSADGTDTIAVVWSVDQVFDLNSYAEPIEGIVLTEAVAANDYGQILCRGIDELGVSHAILLSTIGN